MSKRIPKSAKKSHVPAPETAPHGRPPAVAYEHFRPAALALAPTAVQPCRGDLALAMHNVQLGVANVRPHAARLAEELPAMPLEELWELPDLAAAALYADGRLSGPPTKLELGEKLTRLRKLREPMLLIAEGLALLGLLPTARVTAIRAGTGPVDLGRDGIALEALYHDHAAALAGKHPFTAADLHEVADLGNFVVRTVTPQGGRQPTEPENPESQLRDRLYTLMAQRHEVLRRAGYYLYGDACNEYVPPLGSRVVGARKAGDPADSPAAGEDQKSA